MKFDFKNKTIVVTGGTRGIGLAIVKLFQEYNAEIIATGTDFKELEKLNRVSNNGKTKYLYLDFRSTESINSFLDYINKHNCIDVLINNAGVNKVDDITDIDNNDWEWINSVNLSGPFLITKPISKIMKKRGYGRIVNISSVFGVVSKARRAAYSTTKWGIIGFTKAIALDLAPHNILVNSVSPGFVDTELTRKILSDLEIKEIIGTVPQGRLANVDEIARAIIFLCSENNSYITGQNIIIDGGFTSA
tara:strand:+ start:169 stop:912 length:744 start_codon:yes stop_codon:yes gene_type:complete